MFSSTKCPWKWILHKESNICNLCFDKYFWWRNPVFSFLIMENYCFYTWNTGFLFIRLPLHSCFANLPKFTWVSFLIIHSHLFFQFLPSISTEEDVTFTTVQAQGPVPSELRIFSPNVPYICRSFFFLVKCFWFLFLYFIMSFFFLLFCCFQRSYTKKKKLIKTRDLSERSNVTQTNPSLIVFHFSFFVVSNADKKKRESW